MGPEHQTYGLVGLRYILGAGDNRVAICSGAVVGGVCGGPGFLYRGVALIWKYLMRLTELEPRWIHPNLFVFRCPHCRLVFLACKNIEMSHKDQRLLFEQYFGEDWGHQVIWDKQEQSWSISGTIPNDPKAAFMTDCTVTPSIDASTSGHWHGSITNGEIVG